MLGLDKRLAAFARLPPDVRNEIAKSLDAETDELVAAEKRAAPVSALEDHPGQLRDSIEKYRTPGRLLSWRIIAGARDKQGRLFGRYVEFGHTAANGTFVPASPFWFPTYRARRKAMRKAILDPARRVIRKLFPKG